MVSYYGLWMSVWWWCWILINAYFLCSPARDIRMPSQLNSAILSTSIVADCYVNTSSINDSVIISLYHEVCMQPVNLNISIYFLMSLELLCLSEFWIGVSCLCIWRWPKVWFCICRHCALFSLVACVLSCSRATYEHALLSLNMAQPTLSCAFVQWNWWLALGQCRLHGGLLHSHQDRVCLLPPHQLCHTHVPINHHCECSGVSV